MEYKRVKTDTNGNPRYVIHFFAFLNNEEKEYFSGMDRISRLYDLAVKKSKKLGGKKYRGKDFSGGIVFQSYNIEESLKDIENIAKITYIKQSNK
jgi:hypothetical protein